MVSLPNQTYHISLAPPRLTWHFWIKRTEMEGKVPVVGGGWQELSETNPSSTSGLGEVSQQRTGGTVTTGSGEGGTNAKGLGGNPIIHIVHPWTVYKRKWWTRLVGGKSDQEHLEMNKRQQKEAWCRTELGNQKEKSQLWEPEPPWGCGVSRWQERAACILNAHAGTETRPKVRTGKNT